MGLPANKILTVKTFKAPISHAMGSPADKILTIKHPFQMGLPANEIITMKHPFHMQWACQQIEIVILCSKCMIKLFMGGRSGGWGGG